MTPENINHRIDHRIETHRLNRNNAFMNINGATWTDICKYGCGYPHLTSATKGIYIIILLLYINYLLFITGMRMNCCDGGNALKLEQEDGLFAFNALSPEMKKLLLDNIAHLSRASSFYNNMLAFCSTGVDNGKSGGFEKRIGDHCVTLCGKIYHHFPMVCIYKI